MNTKVEEALGVLRHFTRGFLSAEQSLDTLAAHIAQQDATIARMREALELWPDAYAAFRGAFDTPAEWRKRGDEYAVDARNRLHELDGCIAALNQGEVK